MGLQKEWVQGFLLNSDITNRLLAKLGGSLREGLIIAKSLDIQELIIKIGSFVVVQFLKHSIIAIYSSTTLVSNCCELIKGD